MNAPRLLTPDTRKGFSYAFPYDEVIKSAGQWVPQAVHNTHSTITVRYSVNKYAKGEKVIYVIKVLALSRILFHFLVDTV